MSDLIDQHAEVVDRIYHHLRDVRQRHDVDWHVRREVDFFGPEDDKQEDTPTGEMDVALVGDDWIDYLEVKTNGKVSRGRRQIREARQHFEEHGFELDGAVYAVRKQAERSSSELLEDIREEMGPLFTPDDLREELFEYQKEFGMFGDLVAGDQVIDVTEISSAEQAVDDPRYDHHAMLEEELLGETDDGYTRTSRFWDHRSREESVYQVNREDMDVPVLDPAYRDLLDKIDRVSDDTFTYHDICDSFEGKDNGRWGTLVDYGAVKRISDVMEEYGVEDGLDQEASQRQLEEDGRYDDELLVEEGILDEQDGRYELAEEPDEGLFHIAPDAVY